MNGQPKRDTRAHHWYMLWQYTRAHHAIGTLLVHFAIRLYWIKLYVAPMHGVPCSNLRESRFSRILEIFFEISLLDLDLEVFQFHFHFSKRVKEKIISLFISQKEWKDNFFHFSFLEKSETISDFTLFLEKKEWNHATNTKMQYIE